MRQTLPLPAHAAIAASYRGARMALESDSISSFNAVGPQCSKRAGNGRWRGVTGGQVAMQELYLSPRAAAARGASGGGMQHSHFRLRNPAGAAGGATAGASAAAVAAPIDLTALNIPDNQVRNFCAIHLQQRTTASWYTAPLVRWR